MAFSYADRQLLVSVDEHIHTIERMILLMAKGMDALVAAVDNNANATDALSDEVQEAIDYIKNHSDNDPALFALAARLEEKNAKANKAKTDLDKATADAADEEHARGM